MPHEQRPVFLQQKKMSAQLFAKARAVLKHDSQTLACMESIWRPTTRMPINLSQFVFLLYAKP